MIIVCMLGSSFSCLCKILFILDKFEIKENNLFGMEAALILQIQDLSHDITLAEMMCVIQFFIVVWGHQRKFSTSLRSGYAGWLKTLFGTRKLLSISSFLYKIKLFL